MSQFRFLLALGLIVGGSTMAAESPSAASSDDLSYFTETVEPVLVQHCYGCHGNGKDKGGFNLYTIEALLKGGESGAAVDFDNVAESILVDAINYGSYEMPPSGKMPPERIAILTEWIRRGVPMPERTDVEEIKHGSPEVNDETRAHWAFQQVRRPAVPQTQHGDWVRNPIDAFIAAAHEQHGLVPQPSADRRVWLRRVTLDLTGLPPTPSEVSEFLADDSEMAYQRVVTRLLDSPQYGERWGRHWMDIWRYSDWWGLGAEVRNSQKHIWHWRDWIIESLNADTGYDQMLREMLAADELYPNDLDRLRATGFLARQYFKFNRTTWLDGAIEHTGKAMLGLTLNCAKCHDHK
ncbi:MAG: DUF1549 domain-containing protein, partial [Planctomycetales bacterium]|nr:DUF1549 domain-containing protein [Planctomycetales bacterium]